MGLFWFSAGLLVGAAGGALVTLNNYKHVLDAVSKLKHEIAYLRSELDKLK